MQVLEYPPLRRPSHRRSSARAEASRCRHCHQVLDTVSALSRYVSKLLLDKSDIAVDFEGVALCRTGELCIVQIAQLGRDAVLVDICALGERAFAEGRLRELFESEEVLKLGYDGRADYDALNALGVRMRGYFDCQVLYCTRRDQRGGRRDPFVKGLGAALVDLLSPTEAASLTKIKKTGLQLFAPYLGGSYEVWRARPLNPLLITYAVADVAYLHRMRLEWRDAVPLAKMMQISKTRIEKFMVRALLILLLLLSLCISSYPLSCAPT